MTTVGIIVAMRSEAKPLLKLVGKSTEGKIGGRRCWRFQAGPCRCVMVLSGMGLEPARKAARDLVEAENPQAIVSFGIAGAMKKGHAIGDIVAGERCLTWENGELGAARPLAALPEAAARAVAAAAEMRGAQYTGATVVTVRGLQSVHAAIEGTAVLEMETFGIAHVALELGIPLYSLRAISDSPEEPIPFTMGGGEDFHVQPLSLLGAIIRNPRIIRPLLRLKDNAGRASRNLAEAMLAALSHM